MRERLQAGAKAVPLNLSVPAAVREAFAKEAYGKGYTLSEFFREVWRVYRLGAADGRGPDVMPRRIRESEVHIRRRRRKVDGRSAGS